MKRRVADLTEKELDYLVAKIEVDAGNITFDSEEKDKPLVQVFDGECSTYFSAAKPHTYGPFRGPGCGTFAPSTDWSFGGHFLLEYAIGFKPISDAEWEAEEYITGFTGRGPTPLIASMRALVASVYGDSVEEVVS